MAKATIQCTSRISLFYRNEVILTGVVEESLVLHHVWAAVLQLSDTIALYLQAGTSKSQNN